MKEMSKEEIQTFLMTGTLTGNVSTVRKDGRPHVVPIWFIVENDDSNINIVFTTGLDSLKAKHMLRDPRVSLCVDDQAPPFSFVIVDGIAEINQKPDLNELLRWATKIAGRIRECGSLREEECRRR
jgi:PPOX class probable F420-dependent enzyme